MLSSATTDLLATALSAAQGELGDAAKSSFNPGFKSKYADLAEVLQTIRPIAAKNGLSFVQGVAYDDGLAKVVTRLMHKSGQFLEESLSIPVTKKDAQGLGSAFTYGRRYSIAAFFGIAQDDDDGESASPRKAKTVTVTPRETQVLEPSSIVKVLISELKTVGLDSSLRESDELVMKRMTSEFAALTALEQTQVLPEAKAARLRLEALKA